jgi:hypothetical protein
MNDEERLKAIRDEAEKIHEAAELSSETQFEYAKRWRTVDRWVGSAAAALAAVAGVGGLSKVLSVAWAEGIAVASALVGAISASIAARRTLTTTRPRLRSRGLRMRPSPVLGHVVAM